MADGLDHSFHLMLTSLMDRDFKPGVALGSADLVNLRRSGEAVFEFDAPFERIDFGVIEHALHFNEIRLRHMVARMEQRLGQVAMIRQQHEPFTIEIQPADREHSHRDPMQVVFHGGAAFGIIERGHDVLGLVQNQVNIRLCGPQMFAVDLDVVAIRINFSAKLLHHVAVNGHPSGHNQFLGLAPRRNPGTGNQLLKTNFHRAFR